MPNSAPENTENLASMLVRASSDLGFREILLRSFRANADPTYEAYVERKKRKGQAPLDRDRWEALVFGKKKQKSPGKAKPKSNAPVSAPAKPKQITPVHVVGQLFTPEDLRGLPGWPSQSHGNKTRLFAEVPKSYEHLLEWLNQGQGIDKEIDARVVRRDQNPRAELELDQPGPVIIIAPPKSPEEAQRKVSGRYGGDWNTGANDLVRATIGVDSFDDLPGVVEKLRKSGMQLVARPRDRFHKPTDVGYRDVIMYVRLPNGHVAELQLHLKAILKAKDQAHPFYSRIKGLDRQIRLGGRDRFSSEELRVFDENMAAMRKLYDEAWKEARGTQGPRSKGAGEESGLRYYDFDGVPVVWDRPMLPQIVRGDKKVRVDDLADFAEQAVEIPQSEFERKIADQGDRGMPQSKAAALMRLARHHQVFRASLTRELLAEDEEPSGAPKPSAMANPDFKQWWEKRYKGKRVPNPNPETRDQFPDVSASTAMKDPQFRSKVYEEFKRDRQSDPPTSSTVPPQSSAPAQSPHLDIDNGGFQQIGKQSGSNPGGLYASPSGEKFYVKTPKSEDHARNEILAAKLYELAKVRMPQIGSATRQGKPSVYSKIIPGLRQDSKSLTSGTAKGVGAGMGADAWLANWDVIGLDYDNLLLDGNNEAVRLDTGGALRYRAMGDPKGKAFGPEVTEMKIFTDPERKAGGVFGKAPPAEIAQGIDNVTQIPDKAIHDLVEQWGPKDESERKKLYQTLLARREDLKKWKSHFEQKAQKSAAIARSLRELLQTRAAAAGV